MAWRHDVAITRNYVTHDIIMLCVVILYHVTTEATTHMDSH